MYKCVGTLSKEYHASISNIMRPVKADSIPQLTKLGFPVRINKNIYILCRDAKI